MIFTKASEASWSYFCDSKVSFYRVQILTPDYSGRRSPPPPPPLPPLSPPPLSPPPPLSSSLSSSHLPSSLLPLRKFDSVLFGIRLALRILRTHSLTLTLTAALAHSYSHSHSLTVLLSYYFSYLSYFFLISLISFSSFSLSLSLSLLCFSSFHLSSFSSFAGGSGQRAIYKGLFTLASKKSAVFFPTSLPSTFPFWSASFRPPPWP